MEHFIYFKRLCLMMICCLFVSLTSWADDYTKDGITYSLNEANNTAILKAVTDKSITSAKIRARVAGCNVTEIGYGAFQNCTALKTVNIPTSVTAIDSYAFARCTSLTNISIIGVENISYNAFAGCSSLKNIDFGQNVSSISSDAFKGCNAIESFNLNNDYYSSEGSVIFNSSKTRLICAVGNLGNYAIPLTVTSIGHNAFNDCIYLKNVSIPNSVTSIEYSAFSGCTALTSVTIPNGVTNIESSAFSGCTALTSVTIPNGVTSIGDYTFNNCTALTSVTIPNGVTSIGSCAFKSCTALTSVTIPNTVTSIGSYAFDGNDNLNSVLLKSKDITISRNAFTQASKIICVPFNEDNKIANYLNIYLNSDYPSSIETVESFTGGTWYILNNIYPNCYYDDGHGNYYFYSFNYDRLNPNISDIVSTNEAAKAFIANRKTIYDRLNDGLRTPLENVLNETSNVEDFFNWEENELNALKTKLNTAYNNVRNVVYEQLDLNDDLYELYQQGKEVEGKIHVATENVSQENIDKIANTSYGYHDGLITDASQLSTDAKLEEGTLENLIDANTNSYIHTPLNPDALPYLQIDLIKAYQNIILKYSQIDWGLLSPYGFHIYASNVNDDYNWTDLGTVYCTYNYENGKTGITALNLGKKYRYIRLILMGGVGDSMELTWNELHAYEANFNNVVPSSFQQSLNNTLEQAKSELDNEYAKEETIEKLQGLIDKFNDAPLMNFAKSEYLTLYSDKALIVPEELSAAVVLSDGDNVRSDYRYEAGAIIPANTGVLLKSTKGNSFYMIEGETEETAPVDNLLHGTLNDEMTDVEGAGKYYKLSYDRDTKSIIGFYWGATDGAAFLNKAGKAFLALPTTMNAQQLKGFALSDLDNGSGNVTSINNITDASDKAFRAYDLNGRQVNAKSLNDLQQGVYIVNGKKIIK